MNDDALKVGDFSPWQAGEVAFVRMAVEQRVELYASIATQFMRWRYGKVVPSAQT
jgi:hypothetical protein